MRADLTVFMLEMNSRVEKVQTAPAVLLGAAAAPRSTPPNRLIVGAILPKLSQRSNVVLAGPDPAAICPDMAHEPPGAGGPHA
jgi:hypothetical protein